MQMDTRIPLAGMQPDFVGAMRQGNALAGETNMLRQQNALANLFQRQGPQIAAGDQNALNALARFDPNAALGVQQTRQGMEIDRESLNIARQNARLRTAELTAQMGAAERAQAAQQYERGIAMLTQVQTPEQFAQVMQTPGFMEAAEAIVGPGMATFENRNLLIAGGVGVTEALKMGGGGEEPAAVQTLRIRAQEAGLQPGTPEYQQFMAQGGVASGTDIAISPEGGITFRQGAGVGGGNRTLTEGQSRDNVLVTRAVGALEAFEPVADALTSRGELLAERVPLGLGREAQSEQFQLAMQAGQELLAVILRKDTGAAITRDEQDIYGGVFLPQPGDAPAVLQQKALARRRAVEAIQSGMSPDQILTVGRALVAAGDSAGAASMGTSPASPPAASADQIMQLDLRGLMDVDVMSLDEAGLAAFDARMREISQ